MKAIVLEGFGGPEVLRVGEVERPRPAARQVLISVAATSVNRPDIIQRQGNYPPPEGESDILGLEVAGTIQELGDGVDGFTTGDRVMALIGGGGYAEYATAHTSHVMRIPDRMSFDEAACVCEVYITAFMNIFLGARFEDGETILLHGGGGGVNSAALQLCKTLTPKSRVIVTASSGKLDRVTALGADMVIDYRNEGFAEAVLEHTHHHGADVILDHIGAAYLEANLKALAIGGRLAIIGAMGGREATINLGRLMVKRQSVIGSVLRPRPIEEKGAIIAKFNEIVMPLFADGRIVPIIHRVYPIEEAAVAHETMEASAHFGKMVLSFQTASE